MSFDEAASALGGAVPTAKQWWAYCDQADLTTKERLDLFIKVCQAIQHAHQKGIIHRDIKPSNILVTLHDGVPVPRVIDFGIAKATKGRLTDATVYTQLHQFIGTPAYMSPEQAELSGLEIDTRRNKLVFTGATAAVVALVAGIGGQHVADVQGPESTAGNRSGAKGRGNAAQYCTNHQPTHGKPQKREKRKDDKKRRRSPEGTRVCLRGGTHRA